MKNKKIVLSCVGFLVILIPLLYAVYYSMPANDDYALALEWFSSNRLIETANRVGWNYMNWFGQSGVLAVAIQTLMNPLYWFKDSGHSFGVCMMIVFVLIYIGLIIAIYRIGKYLLQLNSTKSILFTLATVTILFTGYYYPDVYNWWSGVPGYSLSMLLMFVTIGTIAKYIRVPKNRTLISFTITGVITCCGLMNCVAMGTCYLILMFYINKNKSIALKTRLIPIGLFIISGVITAAAPGNFARAEDKERKIELIRSIGVTFYFIFQRIVYTIVERPWILLVLVILVILGLKTKAQYAISGNKLVIYLLAVFVSTAGSLYPYILGENKEFNGELASRANYVMDYVLLFGFSVIGFLLGQYIDSKEKTLLTKIATYTCIVMAVYGIVWSLTCDRWKKIVQYDIYSQRNEIASVYNLWQGVIDEISESNEDYVTVELYDATWTTPYTYSVGIDAGENTKPLDDGDLYGNCNQCVAKWYNKKMVRVLTDKIEM